MRYSRRTLKKWWVWALVAAFLVLVGLFLVKPLISVGNSISDHFAQQRDRSRMVQEMKAAWPTIQAALQPLGIVLSPPGRSECEPGDPLLYRFYCVVRSQVSLAPNQTYPKNPAVVAQQLQTLDAQLKKDGWRWGSNDYRTQAQHPTDAFSIGLSNYANLSAMLAATGMEIEYIKGSCDLETPILVSQDQMENFASGAAWFDCAKDDGAVSQ